MRKLLFISLGLSFYLIFFSCKKQEATDIPIGTISVDINGTASTFDIQTKATTPYAAGEYAIQVMGYKLDPAISTSNLSFEIESPNPIAAGTYTENAAGNPVVFMDHFSDVLLGLGTDARNDSSVTNPVSITITQMTPSLIRGTFKGELKEGGGVIETLSNGVFYVRF